MIIITTQKITSEKVPFTGWVTVFHRTEESNCTRYLSYDSTSKATEDKSLLSISAASVLNLP